MVLSTAATGTALSDSETRLIFKPGPELSRRARPVTVTVRLGAGLGLVGVPPTPSYLDSNTSMIRASLSATDSELAAVLPARRRGRSEAPSPSLSDRQKWRLRRAAAAAGAACRA
jgi:hypothetical protein